MLLLRIIFLIFCSSLCFSAKAQLEAVPQSGSKAFITNAIYSPASKIIAQSEYRVSRLTLIDARSKLKVTEIPTEGSVISLATDSAGQYIIAATEQGRIHFVDTRKLTITRTINANAATAGAYFVFHNYFPLLFTKEHLYFTGYVSPADSSLKGNFRKASKVDILTYYIYRYNLRTNEVQVFDKYASNKPYAFFWNKKQSVISLLGEKFMVLINAKDGSSKEGPSTRHLSLSTFSDRIRFADGTDNNRIGLLKDSDNTLRWLHTENLQQTDSISGVYRFLAIPGNKILYQGMDRYFYISKSGSSGSQNISRDSIDFRPWCYELLDFKQGMVGGVTVNGLASINLNLSTVHFPPASPEPLPWGLCTTLPNTLVYATGNTIYEFDYASLHLKRELATLSSSIKKSLFVPGEKARLVLITMDYNNQTRTSRDTVTVLDYATGKILWQYAAGQEGIDNVRVSSDGKTLMLLTGKSAIHILDMSSGMQQQKIKYPDRIFGADFKGSKNDLYTGLVSKNNQYHIQGFSATTAPFSYKYFESNYPFRVFEMDHAGNYAAVAYPEDSRFYVIPLIRDQPMRQVEVNARVMGFSPDNKWLATGSFGGGYVRLFAFPSLEPVADFKCGVGKVFDLQFSPDGKFLFATIEDGYTSMISLVQQKKVADLFLTGNNFLVKSAAGYYSANKDQVNDIGLRSDNRCYPISNADLKYNRPDLILKETAAADTSLTSAYAKAFVKRVKKAGIDAKLLEGTSHFPEALISNAQIIPASTAEKSIRIPLRFSGAGTPLKSYNLFINGVPLFGAAGRALSGKQKQELDTSITIELSPGKNRIEAECTNLTGIRSIRDQAEITCTRSASTITYFIGMGIDRFAEAGHQLYYSVKDIRDLARQFNEKYGKAIRIDTLFNEELTIDKIKALKKKLLQSRPEDKVIVAYSGHGLLNKDFDYFLSTYAVQFDQPEKNGLPYEELENLLDSIPARKKLLLIDACHSGEVDKEEMTRITATADSLPQLGTKGGKPTYTGKTNLGMKNSFELMQTLFVNVGRSTGATIISAAAGTQFAQERGDLKNGVFTYSILEAMNKYPSITISELKKIAGERVAQLTRGLQQPTSRNEPMMVDWEL